MFGATITPGEGIEKTLLDSFGLFDAEAAVPLLTDHEYWRDDVVAAVLADWPSAQTARPFSRRVLVDGATLASIE